MIRWLLYLPLSLLSSAICYLTNWFVMFFADINGELPGIFKYWQTWDNSTACSESVEFAPKFLQYDWAKHYTEHKDSDEYLRSVNRKRWYVTCIDPNFTLWERVQRYCCGVLWLTRNCSYGFAFYLLGYTAVPPIDVETSENTIRAKERNGEGWMYKNTAKIFSLFGWAVHWNNLLGWKLDTSAQFDTRSMIANRVAFSFKREGEE